MSIRFMGILLQREKKKFHDYSQIAITFRLHA